MGGYPITIAGGPTPAAWQRPTDWLNLGSVAANSAVFLVGVRDTGDLTYVAMKITTSAGGATVSVDWGDGNTTTETSGSTFSHGYDVADLSGTETTDGYYQAICVVTPLSGNITAIDIDERPAAWPGTNFSNNFLHFVVNTPSLTSFTTGETASLICKKVELLDIGSVSSLANKFKNWRTLSSVTANLQNVTSLNGFCYGDYSVAYINLTNYSGVLDFTDAFRQTGISNIYLPSSTAAINLSRVGFTCYGLTDVEMNCSSVTTNSSNFVGSTNIERLILTGMRYGVDLTGLNLGASAIEEFYQSLGTASGAQTITVIGNPGASASTATATGKGFTVTTS